MAFDEVLGAMGEVLETADELESKTIEAVEVAKRDQQQVLLGFIGVVRPWIVGVQMSKEEFDEWTESLYEPEEKK